MLLWIIMPHSLSHQNRKPTLASVCSAVAKTSTKFIHIKLSPLFWFSGKDARHRSNLYKVVLSWGGNYLFQFYHSLISQFNIHTFNIFLLFCPPTHCQHYLQITIWLINSTIESSELAFVIAYIYIKCGKEGEFNKKRSQWYWAGLNRC